MRAVIVVACNPTSYDEQLKLFIVPTAICCGIRLHVSTAFDSFISPCRSYVYSFFGVRNVISTNLEGRVIGFLAFFCMDELFMVCQVCTADYTILFDIIKSFFYLYYLCFVRGFCEETNMHSLDLRTREN
jgi:hypothetical protein